MERNASEPVTLSDPQLEIGKSAPSSAVVDITVWSAEARVELGAVFIRDLVPRLEPALRLEQRTNSRPLGHYDGHIVFAGISSYSYRTLYLYQPDANTLGFMIEDKDGRSVADGKLDHDGRETWLSHLRELIEG